MEIGLLAHGPEKDLQLPRVHPVSLLLFLLCGVQRKTQIPQTGHCTRALSQLFTCRVVKATVGWAAALRWQCREAREIPDQEVVFAACVCGWVCWARVIRFYHKTFFQCLTKQFLWLHSLESIQWTSAAKTCSPWHEYTSNSLPHSNKHT